MIPLPLLPPGPDPGRWEPKFKIPTDETTSSDPFGFNPYAKHETEWTSGAAEKRIAKIPDFQGGFYTWPMPIVDGQPGHHTHPNRRFASPPPPAHQFEMHDGTKGPKQSSHTPFPSINEVGRWPHYPGASSPDWLHLKDPQRELLLETDSSSPRRRRLRGPRRNLASGPVGVEKLTQRLDKLADLATQVLGAKVVAGGEMTPAVRSGAAVSRTSQTVTTTTFHTDNREEPALWKQVREVEQKEHEGASVH